jgi:rubredoxin
LRKDKEVRIMIKYRCTICEYIYDPEVGDIPRIQPITTFEDLPDDWICPQCGVGKDMFEKM